MGEKRGRASLDTYGVEGTPSRRRMGLLPPVGQWVRLEVPASQVGLDGRTLQGMAFTLYGGQATWDHIGKRTAPKASLQPIPDGMVVTWPSVPGQTYRVVYKVALTDPGWLEISGPITASDITTTWTDITVDFDPTRFYQIVQ